MKHSASLTVEVIAAERIGRETATYVANIYNQYYVACRLVVEEAERRAAAKAAVQFPEAK